MNMHFLYELNVRPPFSTPVESLPFLLRIVDIINLNI